MPSLERRGWSAVVVHIFDALADDYAGHVVNLRAIVWSRPAAVRASNDGYAPRATPAGTMDPIQRH
jgi:hypothetical protein